MHSKSLIDEVTEELRASAEPAFRESVRRHFAMNVERFLGVRGATIRKIAAKHFASVKPLEMDERLALCDALLATRLFECKTVAFDWAHRSRRLYVPLHFRRFYGWLVDYVDDWNDCDDLSIHVLGELFLRFPDCAVETTRWAHGEKRWVKRAAAVSLILPLRKGQQLVQAFAVADAMLSTDDDLLQKAYGWLLKEAAREFQSQVFEFIMQRRRDMPRTALRCAVEKMPPALRRQAMA